MTFNISTTIPVVNTSTMNLQAPAPSDANVPDVVVTASRREDADDSGANLLVVPRSELLTVHNLTQAVSIESITSNEDDDVLC